MAQDNQQQTPEETKQELDQAIQNTQDVIYKATSPFQVAPVILSLDRAQIVIKGARKVSSERAVNLPIEDIANVTGDGGLFFGHVSIEKRAPGVENFQHLGPFWRSDAFNFAYIAQGYVIALKRGIDITPLSTQDLRNKLRELGKT